MTPPAQAKSQQPSAVSQMIGKSSPAESVPPMMGKPSPQMTQRSKAEERKESQRLSQYQPLKAQEWLEKIDVATKDVVKAD